MDENERFYKLHSALMNDIRIIILKNQLDYLAIASYFDRLQNDPDFCRAEYEKYARKAEPEKHERTGSLSVLASIAKDQESKVKNLYLQEKKGDEPDAGVSCWVRDSSDLCGDVEPAENHVDAEERGNG